MSRLIKILSFYRCCKLNGVFDRAWIVETSTSSVSSSVGHPVYSSFQGRIRVSRWPLAERNEAPSNEWAGDERPRKEDGSRLTGIDTRANYLRAASGAHLAKTMNHTSHRVAGYLRSSGVSFIFPLIKFHLPLVENSDNALRFSFERFSSSSLRFLLPVKVTATICQCVNTTLQVVTQIELVIKIFRRSVRRFLKIAKQWEGRSVPLK